MRTQILIVDEMHNLVLRTRPGAEASDFLRHIAERVQATMIHAGVEVEKAGILRITSLTSLSQGVCRIHGVAGLA